MNSEEKVGKGTQDTELNALKEVLRVNDKFVKSKRKGDKGFSKESYICPKSGEFGINMYDCYRCESCVAIRKYHFDGLECKEIYCKYPSKTYDFHFHGHNCVGTFLIEGRDLKLG